MGIHHQNIFESAIGKIKHATNPFTLGKSYWEFENGVDWLRYKAHYIRIRDNYNRTIGWNG